MPRPIFCSPVCRGGPALRGRVRAQLSGTVQNDILKEYIARGTYIYPLAPGLRLVADLFAWTGQNLPKWNPISISGYHMREAGATAVQEVAFSLANGRAYLDALRAAGLDIEQSAMRFSFFFAAHNDFFEEVAKFRAARRLWARSLQEQFGLDARSAALHAQTAGSTLTVQQPENNLARTACRRFAPFSADPVAAVSTVTTEAMGRPARKPPAWHCVPKRFWPWSRGVAQKVDPLAGATTSSRLPPPSSGRRALPGPDRCDGGHGGGDRTGLGRREIEDAAFRHQQAVDGGATVVVGVNRFTVPTEIPRRATNVDETVQRDRSSACGCSVLAAIPCAGGRPSTGSRSRPLECDLMPVILEAGRKLRYCG